MLKIDFTLFVQIANFLFLLFILNIIVYRPIRNILGKRSREENSFRDMIEDFQGRSERGANELKVTVAEARKEGYNEKEDLKKLGLEEEKRMLQEAMVSAEQEVGKAKKEIQQTAAEARQSLEKEIAVFSQELAEKILGRSL